MICIIYWEGLWKGAYLETVTSRQHFLLFIVIYYCRLQFFLLYVEAHKQDTLKLPKAP